MSDVKDLTAEELASLHDGRGDMNSWAEIRRRLERLEKCEAELANWQRISGEAGDAHNALEVKHEALKKRLEQCEATLRAGLNRHGKSCLCSSCDAARAALEGK